jgi:hypothetical protein
MPYPDAKYPPEYRPEKQEPMARPTCGTPGAIWSKLEEMHEDTVNDQQPRTKEAANMSDDTEPSPASAGSQPVAWAVWSPTWDYPISYASIYKRYEEAVEVCGKIGCSVDDIVPLYRSPTLTDEEREAIKRAIFRCTVSARARRLYRMDDLADEDRNDAETFSGLLKRIG